MTPIRHLPRLLLVLTMAAAQADSLFLSDGDVYFQYKPVTGGAGLCGFQIRGNHMSRKIPRPEWDINIDELVAGDKRIAGISAGAFEVTSNDRKIARNPRAPITVLNFAVDGDNQPITTKIVGEPNAANAVRAVLEAEPAMRLFVAFRTRKLITVSLTYQDGTADELQVRGWSDFRKFGGGQNNFFDECLRGLAPYSNQKYVVP
jgi:hypothetical protein